MWYGVWGELRTKSLTKRKCGRSEVCTLKMNVAFLTFRCIYNGYIDAMLVFSPLLFISRHAVPLTPRNCFVQISRPILACRVAAARAHPRLRVVRGSCGLYSHHDTSIYLQHGCACACVWPCISSSARPPRCVSVRRCKPSGKCGMRIVSSQRCVCLCLCVCVCVCSVTCPRISFPLWECYCILSSSQLGYDNKSNSLRPHVVLTQHIDTTHLSRFQNCVKYRVWRGKIPTKENLSSDVCFTTLLN